MPKFHLTRLDSLDKVERVESSQMEFGPKLLFYQSNAQSNSRKPYVHSLITLYSKTKTVKT